MGEIAKKVGNLGSSVMTGGLLSTSGKGLLQGGSLKDQLNERTLGMAPGLNGKNNVPVPDSIQRGEWNLSTPDGKLRPDLMLNGQQPAGFTASQEVLGNLRAQAEGKGPTQSAQYLQDANTRNLRNSLGEAEAQGRSDLASTTGNMAMRGGVDAGSRERLARVFGTEGMMNKQRLRNDAAGNNLDILAKDEAQKLQTMQQLPGQLLQQAGFEQDGRRFDIGNTLTTAGGKYAEDMRAWAGNQSAREQAQLANKPSGLLGLGMMGL